MNDREARRRLHKHLIEDLNKPCLWCGSKQDREIDRIIEGYRGGKYTSSNTRVLCQPCHNKRHQHRKFAVGDKVVINGRCPKWLVDQIRHNRLRTITAVVYDGQKACCYYSLGCNKLNDASWDIEAYSFRSYMLIHPVKRSAGRPRTKRHYRKLNCTVAHYNQQQGLETAKVIVEYSKEPRLDGSAGS